MPLLLPPPAPAAPAAPSRPRLSKSSHKKKYPRRPPTTTALLLLCLCERAAAKSTSRSSLSAPRPSKNDRPTEGLSAHQTPRTQAHQKTQQQRTQHVINHSDSLKRLLFLCACGLRSRSQQPGCGAFKGPWRLARRWPLRRGASIGQLVDSAPLLADTLSSLPHTHHTNHFRLVRLLFCGPPPPSPTMQTPRPPSPRLPPRAAGRVQPCANRRSTQPPAVKGCVRYRHSARVHPQVSRRSSQSPKTGRSHPLINSLLDRLGGVLSRFSWSKPR